MQQDTQDENDTVHSAMSNARLDQLISRIDPDAEGNAGRWRIIYDKLELFVMTDEKADRMRIMTPIDKAEGLEKEALVRMMQANFDAALDSRYAIANGVLWGVFIHPLASLTDKDFFSGVAQTLAVRKTYGSTYSSGAVIFQGGDSNDEQRQFYEALMEKANAI